MNHKISLVFPIVGIFILMVLGTTISHLYMQSLSLDYTLKIKEKGKADDIHFIVETLISKEINTLSALSKSLKAHSDLIDGIIHYIDSGDLVPIKEVMNRIFIQLNVDFFQMTDTDHRVIYLAHKMDKWGKTPKIPELSDTLASEEIVSTYVSDMGWIIEGIVPLSQNDKILGALTLGTLIDDSYAKSIAFATGAHVSFGNAEGIIASSLPLNKRTFIDIAALNKSISETETVRMEYSDDFKIVNYAPMGVAGKLFVLIIEIDTGSSYKLAEENRLLSIKISLFIILIVVVLGVAFTYQLLKPLKRLSRKAKETVVGISGVYLKQSRGNEILSMVQSFDVMVQTVNDHIAERKQAEIKLNEHKQQLEGLVGQRTGELSRTNEKLTESVKKLEQHNKEILLLNQMSEYFHGCKSEEETYEVLSLFCPQLFPLDSGFVSVLDSKRNIVKIIASWGDLSTQRDEFPSDQCWAIRRNEEHFVADPNSGPQCSHLGASSGTGYLCTPMYIEGELLGLMHLSLTSGKMGRFVKEHQADITTKQVLMSNLIEHYVLFLGNLRLRETLRVQAIRDPLTGLYNRRYLKEALNREASKAQRSSGSLGVIMIDVDHFKSFNDNYGHEVGDVVLIQLGTFLIDYIRREDFAIRYGGEEFMLVLPGASLENTLNRAEEVRKGIKERIRIHHHGKILSITISLGVAAFPIHGPGIQDTIKASDAALYQAKDNGRDQTFAAPSPSE